MPRQLLEFLLLFEIDQAQVLSQLAQQKRVADQQDRDCRKQNQNQDDGGAAFGRP